MKLLRMFVLSSVLAISGSAFADAEKKDPPKEVSAAEAEKFMGFFNKFVDAVVGNKDNCPGMAKAITGVVDAHQDVIKAANQAKKDKKKLPKAVEDKMMARVKEMMPAMQKCGADKDVKAAVAKLDPK